jgi:hypothetical protein
LITWREFRRACEDKLHIKFKGNKELKGYAEINGKKSLRFVVSKGSGDIPKGTLSNIAREVHVKPDNLIEFTKCTLSGDDIKSIARDNM